MIVVDASALTGYLLGDPDAIAAFEQFDELRRGPFRAPALIEPETLNALRRMERQRIVSAWRATRLVADLGRVRRVLYPHTPFRERVWELRHELSAYDAIYLALAERIGAVLLTADRALALRAHRLLGAERVRLV